MIKVTRSDFLRTGAAVGLAGAVNFPALAEPPPESDMSRVYAAAKKEGSLTWWTAHYPLDAAQSVRAAFMKKYPGIEVSFIRQTAQVLFQRLQQDLKANVNELDVFCSTDEAHYPILKKQNALAVYVPGNQDKIPPQFRGIDSDGTYHTGVIAFIVVNYNNAKISPAPHRWTHLLEPRFRGQITLGHPGFSGYVGNWVVAMNDKYGWDYFKNMNDQQPKINRSIYDTVTDIVNGERTIGAGPDGLTLEKHVKGSDIDLIYPADNSILTIGPIGVLKNAPHPNAARLFASYFYSPEYSKALVSTYNYPLRYDVKPANGMTLDKIKWQRNTVERLNAAVPEVIAKWRDTFGV